MVLLRRRKLFGYVSRFKVVVYCIGFVFIVGFIQVFSFVEEEGIERTKKDRAHDNTHKNAHETPHNTTLNTKPMKHNNDHDRPIIDTVAKVKPKTGSKPDVETNTNHTKHINASDQECKARFGDTLAENLRVISAYPRDDVNHVLEKIKGGRKVPSKMVTSFPVIATAANAGFYEISQGLLKSLHTIVLPKYTDLKIIYYDLGLRKEQVDELNKFCKCDVRKFPFENYPPHVKNLKSYAWKPIIVQEVMMEYGWVWWMDSSVRFITNDLHKAIQYSRDNHFLFFTYDPILSVGYNTDIQTMQYLHEDPCLFRPFGEIEATFVLFHFDNVTSALVETWCACALSQNCIAPPGTGSKLGCNVRRKEYGRCHRFDQAVLSVLLRRLYHSQNDYPLVDVPFKIHEIRRGNRVTYFDELQRAS